MGMGDAVMSSALAEQMPAGRRAVFGDGKTPVWSAIWENNPKIAGTTGPDTNWVADYPGHRPYIKAIEPKRYVFNESFRAPYGRIYLSQQERDWAARQVKGDYVLVEPYVKDHVPILKLGANKAWNGWDELLKMDLPWLQIGDGTKKAKTRFVHTGRVRNALAMVAGAKLVVTTDGMLHHAAAALGVPAVVLWGGVVSPKILGYPTHINIWNGAESCGSYAEVCPHCREAMDSISVEQVKKHL
jgi:hypothetical protein